MKNFKEEVKYKLDTIANIWNHFIWEFEFCKRRIDFTSEVETNYFGDILGYFHDTFDIIFNIENSESHSNGFSNQISFLQSIYVQQDLILELLLIFECGLTKRDLNNDPNYADNRKIRNELVGHPINRYNGELISSALFSYRSDNSNIEYLRYHKENGYEFESLKYSIENLTSKHVTFLIKYLDIILDKLRVILIDFLVEIENFEKLIDNSGFNKILDEASKYFESIFKYDFIYDKESLLIIYSRKEEHRRYQNLIDKFYSDLKNSLNETKSYITDLLQPRKELETFEREKPIINIKFKESSEISNSEIVEKQTYHYELGKLATKRNSMDVDFFGGTLKIKCGDNKIVLKELEHMEENIYNDIEYFSALRLLYTELKED